nr:SGNH/GDSL hydrolase family protein [Bacteriovorax sp. HI3]
MMLKSLILFIFISMNAMAEKPSYVHKMVTTLPNGRQFKDEARVFIGPKFNFYEYKRLKLNIGWVYSISSRIEHIKEEVNGPGRIDVFYNINEYGQRVIPPPKELRKKHLIIAGDSNTFGIGNKDEDTVTFQMGQAHPDYETYNYGHGGGAPNNTLALMENYPWEKTIRQPEGMMIYIFYPQWMTVRVMGTKEFIKWDGGLSPWYELDSNDQAKRRGYFNKRWLSKVLRIIDSIDRFHWIGDLPKVGASDFKLISRIFLKMKEEYMKKFPKGRFVVAISDYNLMRPIWSKDLMRYLAEDKIEFVEIHKGLMDVKKFHLPDYHFNALGNKYVVEELSKTIKF